VLCEERFSGGVIPFDVQVNKLSLLGYFAVNVDQSRQPALIARQSPGNIVVVWRELL